MNCHTTAQGQPVKGPYLGTIATTYNRTELAEAVLYPDKTIAQGFVTSVFTLKDRATHMGFIVHEGAENIPLRYAAGYLGDRNGSPSDASEGEYPVLKM